MSSKNKGKGRTSSARKGRGRRKKGEKPITEHGRAGLVMPVTRIRKFVKDGRYAPRVSRQAPLYLAAVLEYCGMYHIKPSLYSFCILSYNISTYYQLQKYWNWREIVLRIIRKDVLDQGM